MIKLLFLELGSDFFKRPNNIHRIKSFSALSANFCCYPK